MSTFGVHCAAFACCPLLAYNLRIASVSLANGLANDYADGIKVMHTADLYMRAPLQLKIAAPRSAIYTVVGMLAFHDTNYYEL